MQLLNQREQTMEAVDTNNKLLPWFIRAEQERLCPECGAKMMEMDRLNEGSAVFVWYKCIKDNCRGQWLAKVPRPFYKISSKMDAVGSPAAVI
jgi:hypothetical protein